MLTIKTGAHNETWSALISWGVCNTSASTKQGTCTSRPRAVTQKSPISCMKLSEARWQMSIMFHAFCVYKSHSPNSTLKISKSAALLKAFHWLLPSIRQGHLPSAQWIKKLMLHLASPATSAFPKNSAK